MSSVIEFESRLLLVSLLWGVAAAAAYDILRLMREAFLPPVWLIGVLDFLFFSAAGVLLFAFVFRENDGNIRWYILVSSLLGGFLYRVSIGRLVFGVSSKLICRVKQGIKAFKKRMEKVAGKLTKALKKKKK